MSSKDVPRVNVSLLDYTKYGFDMSSCVHVKG
jgi:hypothetical protein